jgi:hypothetical protein
MFPGDRHGDLAQDIFTSPHSVNLSNLAKGLSLIDTAPAPSAIQIPEPELDADPESGQMVRG